MSEWFYQVMGQEFGPVKSSQLKALADEGQINRDSLVRRGQDADWHHADRVKGLFAEPEPQEAAKPDGESEAVGNAIDDVLFDGNPKPPVAQAPTQAAPKSSTKTCPFCAEEIAAAARKCKHCGEFLDEELRSADKANDKLAKTQKRPSADAGRKYPNANGPDIICPNPNCEYSGPSERKSKGSLFVLVLLLIFFVLPGLLYMLFFSGYILRCPKCGMKVRDETW